MPEYQSINPADLSIIERPHCPACADSRMTLSNQVKEEVAKFFGPKMFQAIIPRNIRLAEAPGFGQSIFQYDAKSRGGEAYMAFAREFLSRRGLAPAPEPITSEEPTENPA